MPFIAVEDIGKIVAAVFISPGRLVGRTFDIASDRVTGHDSQRQFSAAAGRLIL